MESLPDKDCDSVAGHSTSSEKLSKEWSISGGYYYSADRVPDPNILIDISSRLEITQENSLQELPQELIKYALRLTQPELTDDHVIAKDVQIAKDAMDNLISKNSPQDILVSITNKGQINYPVFNALFDISNLYQFTVIDTENIVESARFEEVRKKAYWMVFWLIANQDHLNSVSKNDGLPL